MKHFTERDAKNSFGRLLDTAAREPVAIDRNGRPVAVLLSHAEYEHLQAVDDAVWVALADAAEEEGFIGVEESERLLEELRNA